LDAGVRKKETESVHIHACVSCKLNAKMLVYPSSGRSAAADLDSDGRGVLGFVLAANPEDLFAEQS